MSVEEDLLDQEAVADRLFYPRKGSVSPTFPVSVGDIALGCFRREFDPNWPWVIYFHGNGELAEECDEFIGKLFEQCGANVCFVEYRGYGESSDRTRLGSMLTDGIQVFEALNVPAERTIAFGRSIGSLFAIELAYRVPNLAGLVIESGIAVPHEHWPIDEIAAWGNLNLARLQVRFEEMLNHREKLGRYRGPLLVMHTQNDRLVPVSNAERLHSWGNGSDKRLKIFEWGHHNSILEVNSKEYAESLTKFVEDAVSSR